jgi:two-component system, response regulator PdtaR
MHERTANENANAAPVVLVVEDEWFLLCDLADCLREDGWFVLEAVSADRAMAVCRDRTAVHILITDIQLNGSANGWDVAEAFRAARSDVAVIYTSGDAHDRTRSVPNSLHFNKPYRPTEVVQACRRLMQSHASSR